MTSMSEHLVASLLVLEYAHWNGGRLAVLTPLLAQQLMVRSWTLVLNAN